MKTFLKWEDSRAGIWSSTLFTWDDVALIEQLISSSGGNPEVGIQIAKKLPKKKKIQLIKILATLNGEEFEESKYIDKKDIKIYINDIKFLFENKEKIISVKIKDTE